MEGESAPREGESAEALAARRKADKERKAAEKAEKELQKEANRKAREAAQKVKEVGGAAEADVVAPRVTLRNYETHDFANMFIQSDCPAAARTWTSIGDLTATLAGQKVWVRGRMATSRKQGKMLCFLQLRESIHTVQAVVFSKESDIVPFAAQLPRESVVDVYGEISLPIEPIASCTQSAVELQVRTQRTGQPSAQPYSTASQHSLKAKPAYRTALQRSPYAQPFARITLRPSTLRPSTAQVHKLFCVSRSAPELPLQLEDAARSEAALAADPELPRVNQDVRLNNRVIDLRVPASQVRTCSPCRCCRCCTAHTQRTPEYSSSMDVQRRPSSGCSLVCASSSVASCAHKVSQRSTRRSLWPRHLRAGPTSSRSNTLVAQLTWRSRRSSTSRWL